MSETAVLLSVPQMAEADRRAIEQGVPSLSLMEAAGAAVARLVERLCPRGPVLVLCGPGNNGGDGFVAARYLRHHGRKVKLVLLGTRAALRGDAAIMAMRWDGEILAPAQATPAEAAVIIDAIFGAGLSKPITGDAAKLVEAVNGSGRPVVAVDLPSGIHGDDGLPRGVAIKAKHTVTFFRPKPGHFLLPGRLLCGKLYVADIGIPDIVLSDIGPQQWQNTPALWRALLPRLRVDGHKYSRGHVLVRGGNMTGAACLSGHAALRIGAGLVTLAQPGVVLQQGGSPDALIRIRCDGIPDWRLAIADKRRNAFLLGPGNGASDATRTAVLDALASRRAVVLDADALTAFAADPERLFAAISGATILTPHEGEFARLFPEISGQAGGKLSQARGAARRSGSVIVFKGPDTVIAAPDGRAAISENGPPDLATAGTGDVLAGFCAGLMAQGMPAFEAACAAVWLHCAAANAAGPGMIADDLPMAVKAPLAALRKA